MEAEHRRSLLGGKRGVCAVKPLLLPLPGLQACCVLCVGGQFPPGGQNQAPKDQAIPHACHPMRVSISYTHESMSCSRKTHPS